MYNVWKEFKGMQKHQGPFPFWVKGRGTIQRGSWHVTLSCCAKNFAQRVVTVVVAQSLLDRLCQHVMLTVFDSGCCYNGIGATTLYFIFSRSSHSVLFNGRCYIIFLSSEDKVFLLRREPSLLKKII